MNDDLQYTGISLTENSEGLRLTAYQDSAGVWTNGYGNTHNVTPNSTITVEQAVSDLKTNLECAEHDIKYLVKVDLTQGQYNALVDLVFNIGYANFSRSTLLSKLNSGDYQAASLEIPKWDECQGHVLQGLFTRRIQEREEFDGNAS